MNRIYIPAWAAIVAACFCAAVLLSSCTDYDRDYSADYDLQAQRGTVGVTIRRAQSPGQGSPSFTGHLSGSGKDYFAPIWQ